LSGFGDFEDRRGLAFGLQDLRLLLAVGLENRGRLDTLGLEHHGAAFALCLHLAVASLRSRPTAVRYAGARRASPALPTCRSPRPARRASRALMRSREVSGFVEAHVTDDVTQVGLGQLDRGQTELGNVVQHLDRVGHLVVDDGIDRHCRVVLGDDFLRRHVNDLLTHVDLDEPLDERHDEVEAGLDGALVLTQPFDAGALIGANGLDAQQCQQEKKTSILSAMFHSLSNSLLWLAQLQDGSRRPQQP